MGGNIYPYAHDDYCHQIFTVEDNQELLMITQLLKSWWLGVVYDIINYFLNELIHLFVYSWIAIVITLHLIPSESCMEYKEY